MKFNKILLLMVLVAIGANIEVCAQVAQESAKDSTKNPLATLFKGKRALKEEKDNAAAQQQEAKDVTTENSSALQQQDAIESANSGVGPQKTGTSGNYFVEYEYYKARCEFYQKKCLEYKDGYTKWKKAEEDVERLKNDKDAIIASKDSIIASRDVTIADLDAKNKKLEKIKTVAVDSLKMRVAAAKKMPLSQLAPRLNACEAEYKSIGEGDAAFDEVKTLLDGLSKDLKLFNDVNSVLNSPYSVKSVNSALATIEVLKKNSVGCVERLGELDKKAALLKEYESLVGVFNRMVNTFKVIFESSRKNANSKQIKDAFENNRVQNFINEISKIPYLKAQFEKYYEELNANPMDSSLEDRYIQKK